MHKSLLDLGRSLASLVLDDIVDVHAHDLMGFPQWRVPLCVHVTFLTSLPLGD